MVRRQSEWPSLDELVICTVTEVFDQGAFASLDDYGRKEGMIHITEVASGWVKNIKDFVRKGQKVVCKVLSVDPKKGHIDLSLRRVKEGQRRWRLQLWKREQRAEKLLELAAKKLGKTLDQAYEEVGFPLQKRFGDLYSAFEAVSSQGAKVLEEFGEEWAKVLGEMISSTIEAPKVEVVGYVDLSCTAPDGIEVIKSAMVEAREAARGDGTEVEFYYVGSPRYRIKVIAPSYKVAEAALRKAAEMVIAAIKKAGGKGEFHPKPKGG